jgi:hypothetical protein
MLGTGRLTPLNYSLFISTYDGGTKNRLLGLNQARAWVKQDKEISRRLQGDTNDFVPYKSHCIT